MVEPEKQTIDKFSAFDSKIQNISPPFKVLRYAPCFGHYNTVLSQANYFIYFVKFFICDFVSIFLTLREQG